MGSGQQDSISFYPSLEKYYCLNIAAAVPAVFQQIKTLMIWWTFKQFSARFSYYKYFTEASQTDKD